MQKGLLPRGHGLPRCPHWNEHPGSAAIPGASRRLVAPTRSRGFRSSQVSPPNLARIWLAPDGHIDAGVALMNDCTMMESGSAYNDPNAWQHVLGQEIGHTFGLDHQGSPKKQSSMNDRLGLTDVNFVGPARHDYDTLYEIYGSGSADAEGGGGSKPCNPKSPKFQSRANVHFAPRPGGGWIVTYTVPPGRGLG